MQKIIDEGTDILENNNATVNPQTMPLYSQEYNVLAIVGLIFSFFISIVGLICSTIGYQNAIQTGGNGKEIAIAGMILSGISLIIINIAINILMILMFIMITQP